MSVVLIGVRVHRCVCVYGAANGEGDRDAGVKMQLGLFRLPSSPPPPASGFRSKPHRRPDVFGPPESAPSCHAMPIVPILVRNTASLAKGLFVARIMTRAGAIWKARRDEAGLGVLRRRGFCGGQVQTQLESATEGFAKRGFERGPPAF